MNRRKNFNSALQGKPHPLHLPLVVLQIINYLDFSSLKTARLVCQQWAKEGRNILVRRSKIVFRSSESSLKFLKEMDEENLFVKMYEITDGIEYSSVTELLFVKLRQHCTVLSIHVNTLFLPKMAEMIQRNLLNVNHLKIFGTWKKSPKSFQRIRAFKVFKNLQSLSIDILSKEYTTKVWFSIAYYLLLHLENCEDLKELSCYDDCCLFETLIAVGQQGQNLFQNIIHLETYFQLSPLNLRNFQNPHMPIVNLKLKLPNGYRFPELYSVLSSFGQTLVKLDIDYAQIQTGQVPDSFPCAEDLKNLKYLSMRKFNGPIYFIKAMPSLETLVLTCCSWPFNFILDDSAEFIGPHTLKSLLIFYNPVTGDEESSYEKAIDRIVKWFPYLIKFGIEYATDVALRKIVSTLLQMEELILPNGSYSDDSIIGIDHTLNKLGLSTAENDCKAEIASTNGQGLQTLRNLRSLHMSSPKMTDVAILYGVSRCRELRYLSVMSNLITDESLKIIVDTMNIFSLKMEFCSKLTPSTIRYAKEKMKGRNVSIKEEKD